MTTKTTRKPAETLEQREARIAAETEEIRAERARAEADRIERATRRQAARDERTMAEYDKAALDGEVAAARRALDEAIAADPITKAMTAYYVAAAKRNEDFAQRLAALSRTGVNIADAQHPSPAELSPLHELAERVARDAAHDWLEDYRADFDTTQED